LSQLDRLPGSFPQDFSPRRPRAPPCMTAVEFVMHLSRVIGSGAMALSSAGTGASSAR
jgi:hypothetical protein